MQPPPSPPAFRRPLLGWILVAVAGAAVAGSFLGRAREDAARARAFAGLEVGILLALLLVFAVMAVQFESRRGPLIVMSAIPFGFVGVVLTLVATGTTFSLNAFLGCIVLVGIAVNNAIALTTSTTVLAMLPIALALGEGAEIQAPLARVVLGGLTVSTLITRVLLPALYVLTDRGRLRAAL